MSTNKKQKKNKNQTKAKREREKTCDRKLKKSNTLPNCIKIGRASCRERV